jgi:hypothetical protein
MENPHEMSEVAMALDLRLLLKVHLYRKHEIHLIK